ncbi:MAG TPA: molybdenum cofactor guanylyltransferase [Candidatus Limnocylindrales bacterium]|nr:molybdenum cofactor guanylyltransferase [Candidatus Limnocylindrales bacterium]
MTRAGYVLAGGGSTRMGRDKALLMGAGVADAVRAAAGSATLVGDPERYRVLGFPVIADLWPGEGPLGGIVTALSHSQADANLIVACDMPRVCSDFLKQLLDAWTGGILVPEGPEGRMEPLCAVYGLETLSGLETAFAAGRRKVTAAFEGLPVTVWRVGEAVHFQNVNTPEEWAGHGAS